MLPTSSSTPRRGSRRMPVTISPMYSSLILLTKLYNCFRSQPPAESKAVMNLLTEMQQMLGAVKDKVTGIDMRIDF